MPHIHEKIDFTVGAFIVHDSKILLVNHRELKKWLPVGGHIELDEDVEQALYREIEEEAGLTKNDIEVLAEKPDFSDNEVGAKFLFTPTFVDVHPINNAHKHIGLGYIVKSKSDVVRLAENEHHEIKWFTEKGLDDPKYQLIPRIKFCAREALKRTK